MWWSNARETALPVLCLTFARKGQMIEVESWKPWVECAIFEALFIYLCKLNDSGFQLQNTKPSVEQLRKMWDICQRNPQVLTVVLMFILTQTSELCADFWCKYSKMLCVHSQMCAPAHEPNTQCILQHSFSFCVYCQDSWWIWHFDHVSYSCSYEVGFPQKVQQSFHRMFSSHTGSRCTSPVEKRHNP